MEALDNVWSGSWRPLTNPAYTFRACHLWTFDVAAIGHPYIWRTTVHHDIWHRMKSTIWQYYRQRMLYQIEWRKCLPNSCVFGYDWHCMTMCTCIILLVNLPTEWEGMDQFMWEKKINKLNYVTSSQKLYWLRSIICDHARKKINKLNYYTDVGLPYENARGVCNHWTGLLDSEFNAL